MGTTPDPFHAARARLDDVRLALETEAEQMRQIARMLTLPDVDLPEKLALLNISIARLDAIASGFPDVLP